MKIAVDMDDVIVDFWGRVITCYNMEYGENILAHEQMGWEDNPIKMSPHFGPDKPFNDWWEWWQTRNLWADCKAIPGSIGGLQELHHQGHYIQLVTSKPVWSRKNFLKWLGEWNPYFDDLVVVEEGKGIGKHEVSNADLLIDDRPSNIEGWLAVGRPAILFSQPWNTKWWQKVGAKTPNLNIAASWNDVLLIVDTLAQDYVNA